MSGRSERVRSRVCGSFRSEGFERLDGRGLSNQVSQLTIRAQARRESKMEEDQSFSRLVLVFAIAIGIIVGVILVSMLL
jgi:hypothetical protein